MEIRALTEADADAFRRVRLRALREHPEAFRRAPEEADSLETLKRRLGTAGRGGEEFVLGAFDAGDLVGIVGCRREDGVKCRHVAVIWGMYVTPEARGRGVGRRLLEHAVARARHWPAMDHLWLSVVTTQAPARRLYAACGFRVIGLHPRTIRVGERGYDEELMVLDLR